MDAHFGDASYHVIKQGPEAIDGDVAEWHTVEDACLAVRNAVLSGASQSQIDALYSTAESMIDLDNYIDYVICNSYSGADDWCSNNWRAGKRNGAGYQWRFFIWDAEWTLRPGEHLEGFGGLFPADPARFLTCGGPTSLHIGLREHASYRARFSDRIKKHFFVDPLDPASGALAMVGGTDRIVQLYQNEMSAFESVLFCESARWGGMDAFQTGRTTPMTKSDPGYLPDKPYGDWDRNCAYTVNVWLPGRRGYFLNRMQAVGLFQP